MDHLKISLLTVCSLFLVTGIFSQDSINHWESVVLPGDNIKFFPGESAPDAEWKESGYNDDTWPDGIFSIGYGDDDDSTVIDQVLSLYVRHEFFIVDTSNIFLAVLHMDYDDGFVAYINGMEIARSNVGTTGIEPSWNEPATSNHEALMYRGNLPEEFLISQEKLSACLQPGNNMLSIQVHNVTITSSDMSCIPFLSLGITDETSNYRNTPGWFTPPQPPLPPLEFTSSNLPILIIDTENGVNIPDEPKVEGFMNIVYNTNGNTNFVTGPFHESSGPIGIETRGNVTQSFPKKPYGLETRNPVEQRDSLGENRNVEILGLPAENDWVLRACWIDKTLMRHAIASQMSINMGRYAPRYAFCEVIVNGSYDGVYLFMEKIKQDNDRLNIEELHPWTTDPDSITGGYIYQVAQSGADFGERRRYVYPKADEINNVQTNYIRNYDDNFRSVMDKSNYADPTSGFPMVIDVNAFIDEIIIQEACKNSDAYGWSSFFHKDRGSKLCAGPVWDFDQALTNSTFNDGNRTNEWLINKGVSDVPSFWPKLFNEPKFRYLLKKRWFELRENVLQTDILMGYIDSVALYLDEAQKRNFQRWPVLGEELWRSLPGWDERDTYQKEVDYLKNWFAAHLEWIDTQLASVPDQAIDIPSLTISEIMYSPIQGPKMEFIEIVNTGSNEVDLTGVFFSDGIVYTFPEGKKLGAGEYAVIASNAEMFETRHGFKPLGEYSGLLDNSGERIALQNSLGCLIDEVVYDNESPWPVITINNLGSIELLEINMDNTLPENWAVSKSSHGTPMNLVSGINETLISENGIKVYPNPVVNNLNVMFSGSYKGKLEIEIYDLLGSLRLRSDQKEFTGVQLSLDVKDLPNGYYIMKIRSHNSSSTKQILITR